MTWRVVLALALFVISSRPAHADAVYTPADTLDAIEQSSAEIGVPYDWLYRVVKCESTFDPYARGRFGERGAAQLLPHGPEWRRFFDWGYDDPDDPYQAVRFLAQEFTFGRASSWSCAT